MIIKDGTYDSDTQIDDYFMKCFLRDLCLRPSCYSCNYKSIHRKSDITLADFWGSGKVNPKIFDDKGVSIMLINSQRVNKYLKKLIVKWIIQKLM